MPPEDCELVGWLVAQHLAMSATAQKQDISDPNVVAAFAERVGTERKLVALYLLTVADIRGTSPRVWNAWKGQLLEDLFRATRARLAGKADSITLADSLLARQREAQRLLRLYAVTDGAENELWLRLDSVYFQRHTADEIAWHARHLYWRVDSALPVVRARLSRAEAGLQVLAYLPDQKDLFARISGFFGRRRLSILEAKIHTTRHGYAQLEGSLNPLHEPALSPALAQLHVVGGADEIVPEALVQPFAAKQTRVEVRSIARFTHYCCWENVWKGTILLQR